MKVIKQLMLCLLALVLIIPILLGNKAAALSLNWVALSPQIGAPVGNVTAPSAPKFISGFYTNYSKDDGSAIKHVYVYANNGTMVWDSGNMSYYRNSDVNLITSSSPDGLTAYMATTITENGNNKWRVWKVVSNGVGGVTITQVLNDIIYLYDGYDNHYELVALNNSFLTSFRVWDDAGSDYEWRFRAVWKDGVRIAYNGGVLSVSDTGQIWDLDGYTGFSLNSVAKVYNKTTGAEVWSGTTSMFPGWWETDDGEDRDYDYLKYDPVNNKIYYFYYTEDDFTGPTSTLQVKNIGTSTSDTIFNCLDCSGYGYRYSDDILTMDIQDVMDTAHDFYFYDVKSNVFSFVDRPPGLLLQYNPTYRYHYITSGGVNYLVTFSEVPTSDKVIDIVTETALKGTNLIYNGDFEQGTSGFEKAWGTEPSGWAVVTTPNAISGSHLLDATGDALIRSTKYVPYSRTKKYRLSITTGQANTNNMAILGIFLYDENFTNERWLSLKGYNSTIGVNKIEVDLPQYATYGGYNIRYIRPGLGLNYNAGLANQDYSWADDFVLEDITTLATKADQTVVTALSSEVSVTKSIASNALTEAQTTNETLNTIISPQLDVVEGSVKDGSGNTALSMATLASQNASSAKNQTIYTGGGLDNNKSVAQLSKEGKDKAQEAVTGIANAENSIQSSISNVKTDLQSAINNVQTSVTNIQTYLPAALTKVYGYNNAKATTTSSFKVSLDYSNATEYRYKIDSGSWSSWASLGSHDTNGYFTVTGISGNGMKTIFVEIRNGGSGSISKGKLSIFKL